MTKPGDPEKGKAAEAEQAEQAAKESAAAASQSSAEQAAEASEAGAEAAAKPSGKKEPAPAQAEGTAAEATGVDKAGAEAAAVSEPSSGGVAGGERSETETPKPKRSRSRKAAEPAAPPAETPAPTRRRDRRSGEQVTVRAQAKYVRSSARKARLVADNVRGKTVPEARAILAFSPRQVSEAWSKLLESAVANAENNNDLVGEDLRIAAIYADEGPTIKRYRPRAMGRATRIRKRTSHLTIQLTPKD